MPNREIVGRVQATSRKNGGVKLDEEWWDWSQYADQAEDERPALKTGLEVRMTIDKTGRIRRIDGPNGEPLPSKMERAEARANSNGTDASSDDYARPYRPEDQWRMTLLSCLSSASQIVPRLIGPDGKVGEGEHATSPSKATYQTAVWFARQIWNEQVPGSKQEAPASNNAASAPQ